MNLRAVIATQVCVRRDPHSVDVELHRVVGASGLQHIGERLHTHRRTTDVDQTAIAINPDTGTPPPAAAALSDPTLPIAPARSPQARSTSGSYTQALHVDKPSPAPEPAATNTAPYPPNTNTIHHDNCCMRLSSGARP